MRNDDGARVHFQPGPYNVHSVPPLAPGTPYELRIVLWRFSSRGRASILFVDRHAATTISTAAAAAVSTATAAAVSTAAAAAAATAAAVSAAATIPQDQRESVLGVADHNHLHG